MRTIIFFMFFIFSYSSLISDDFWKLANGPKSSSSISDIAIDSKNNVIVTNGNEIFKSTDGGDNWIKIDSYSSPLLSNSTDRLLIDRDDNLYTFNYRNITIYDEEFKNSNIIISPKFYEDNLHICGNTIYSYSDDDFYYINSDSTKSFYDVLPSREYDSAYYREEVSFGCNYGTVLTMIDFNYWQNYNEDFKLYHSTDLGNTWSELYFIPGTDIDFKNLKIVNDYLWLVDRDSTDWNENYALYNFKTKSLIENLPFEPFHLHERFYTFRDNIYFVDGYSLYHSSDGGMSWDKISEHIFGYPQYDWIDAFAVDSTGVLYAGTRYNRLMKSIDNGKNWTRINLLSETDSRFMRMKYIDSTIYSYDRENIYYSTDKGENWNKIQFDNDRYKISCDLNSKGEIVFILDGDIYYSNDKGLNWLLVDSTLKNKSKNQNGIIQELEHIEITDDSRVFVNSRFMAESYQDTFKIFDDFGIGLNHISDNKYHSKLNNGLAILDSNMEVIEYVFQFSDSIEFYNFTVVNDSLIIIATNIGLFKKENTKDSLELIYEFQEDEYSNIYSDKHGELYLYMYPDLYFSSDLGKTFLKIASRAYFHSSLSFVFEDGRLLTKKDKIYFADLEDKDFLNISLEHQSDTIYFGQYWYCKFAVRNQLNQPVESAYVYISNPITNRFDTLVTDINGMVSYSFLNDYYTSKVRYKQYLNRFNLLYYTDKEGSYRTNLESFELNIKADKFDFWIENKFNKYYNCYFDTTISYYLKVAYREEVKEKSKIVIENSLLNQVDTLDCDGNDYSLYNFDIMPNTKPGMYKLKFTGMNSIGEKSTDYVTYIIVTSKPLTDIESTEYESNSSCSLYPNPATDYIEIKNLTLLSPLERDYELNIYDVLGQKAECEFQKELAPLLSEIPIISGRGGWGCVINVSNLQQGIYFVRVGNQFLKFVKI